MRIETIIDNIRNKLTAPHCLIQLIAKGKEVTQGQAERALDNFNEGLELLDKVNDYFIIEDEQS